MIEERRGDPPTSDIELALGLAADEVRRRRAAGETGELTITTTAPGQLTAVWDDDGLIEFGWWSHTSTAVLARIAGRGERFGRTVSAT